MSTVKQVGLLAAGCQPWNAEVCAASGDRFAYCATLAIYIYQLDRKSNDFKLHSIMSEHKKTISAIAWNPKNPDLFASSSADNQVIVWNVPDQVVVAKLNNTKCTPAALGWCEHQKDCVSFVFGRGPLFLWNYASSGGMSTHKEADNFNSDVCHFKWHPKKTGKMAFGHQSGSISLFNPGQRSERHVLRPEPSEEDNEDDPIVALEWDPLSIEYLLIANTSFGVRLVDTEGVSVIMQFQLPSVAARVNTVTWIDSAPGMFLTGDNHSGIMRLWNVSKSTPIENIRLKKTGFHALKAFSVSEDEKEKKNGSSSNSFPPLTPVTPTGKFALPPANAVCTFLDGGVGLYDLGKRKWNFLRDQGHVETIFDCKFKPDDWDLLATGSFDGTIKIWDVNTMQAVDTSPGNEGVIYCLSWAPSDLNCIAASTSKNGAFIWDISKAKVIKRFTEHAKGSVYSVAWNQKDSRKIATCGADGNCIIRQVDGKLVAKYKHPAAVFGCDWSPHNRDMIATGCEDKNVRVFYLATTSEQPLKVFSGHSAKVFNVRWSPLRDGVLCSGSDDGTIRIWDYTQESCTSVLQGHTAPVRGLHWNHEIPYLLISGSWDYSIRIWDTRDGACLDTVLDHGADVYGLTCHPQRPFVLASSSRDSTVRVWSLTPLVQPLEMNILVGKPWAEVFANPEHAMSQGTPPLLAGKASKDLKQQVDRMQGEGKDRILRWFSKFFASPGGPDNVWDLVSVINGTDDSLLPTSYGKGIMHMKHLTKYRASEAREIEVIRSKKIGIGATKREDRMREAADVHVKVGNIQRYCELMSELGEWDKALAVAPGVSMEFWKTLIQRRAECLLNDDDDDAVPYSVSAGMTESLISFFTRRGQLQDALLVSAATHEGLISVPRTRGNRASQNGVAEDEDSVQLLKHTSRELADWYLRNGSPPLAACCNLAVEDCKRAMAKLIRGHELELAVSVGMAIKGVEELTHIAIEYLTRRCEKLGRWDLAVELLKLIPNSDIELAKLCARCSASMAEINDLHQKASLPTMEECTKEAEKAENRGDVMEAVKFYLLSPTPEVGLNLGLGLIKERMSGPTWKADDVFPVLQLMGCIQTEKLHQHKCASSRGELLTLSAYVGALVATRRKYDSIVPALFKHVLFLMKKMPGDLPLSESLVTAELEAWQAHFTVTSQDPSSPKRKDLNITLQQQETYESLLRRAGEETWPVGVGADIVGASNLPSHSDVHHSSLNGQRIQGPAFFLEDGRSAVSISDALMWAKVNPFSPLGSGVRINPF